jgi:hypothetical protein
LPHFYFDLDDNGLSSPDAEGLQFQSLEVARTEALRGLAEMARDEKTLADKREIVCTVRDGGGPVYRVAVVVRCEALK